MGRTGAFLPTRSGIAYFIVTPSLSSGSLAASIANQGYVSVNQNSLVFPTIGVNTAGKGVMTFTLVGGNSFPSPAYTPIDAVNGAGTVHIAGPGAGPQDGLYLAAVKRKQTTREIVEALKRGGIESASSHFSNIVHSNLDRTR